MTNMRKKRCLNPACGRVFRVASGAAARCPFCNTVSSRSCIVRQAEMLRSIRDKDKVSKLKERRDRIPVQHGPEREQSSPWDHAAENYPLGSVVEGKVVRIVTYGAFVELEPGIEGLVHISQCSFLRLAKVEDAVNIGDIVRVKVIYVNVQTKHISLSIREVLEDEAMLGLEDEPLDLDF